MKEDENIYIIPNFDPNEIISYFNAKNMQIHISEINKPTNQSVLRIFHLLVNHIMGNENIFDGIDDSKFMFVVFKRTGDLLRKLGITFFELKDLQFPTYQRNLNFISTIYNFCIYRDSKTSIINSMREEKTEQDKLLQNITNQVYEKKEQLNKMKNDEIRKAEEKKGIEEKVANLEEEVKSIFKLQKEKIKEVETLKNNRDSAHEKLNNLRLEIANLEQEISEMKTKIVDDPDQMIRLLDQMDLLVKSGKQELEDLTKKIKSKKEKFKKNENLKIQFQNKIQNAIAYQEKMKIINELKDELSRIDYTNQNLVSEINFEEKKNHNLSKQISHIEMKIENIKQKEQENMNESQNKLENLRIQYEKVITERNKSFEKIEKNQKENKEIEFEIAHIKNQHQKNIHLLMSKFADLKDELKKYLIHFEDFLNKNYEM